MLADNLPIGLAGHPGAPPAYITTGVAVSSKGIIYFSSDVENTIYRLRPE